MLAARCESWRRRPQRPAVACFERHRTLHLVASATLVVYLYKPPGGSEIYLNMLRAMVFPLMLIKAIAMWQMPPPCRLARSTQQLPGPGGNRSAWRT